MVRRVQVRRTELDTIRNLTQAGVTLIAHGVNMQTYSRRNGDVVFTFRFPARNKQVVNERIQNAEAS